MIVHVLFSRIRYISNLHSLHKLDVLDLHGNFISEIYDLNHLSELRVLNLAGNQISIVDNLAGLDSLAELNLRRNVITHVVSNIVHLIRHSTLTLGNHFQNDVDKLPVLQRLFLSFNKIQRFVIFESVFNSKTFCLHFYFQFERCSIVGRQSKSTGGDFGWQPSFG